MSNSAETLLTRFPTDSFSDIYIVGINAKTIVSLAISLVIMHVYYTKIGDAPPPWIVRLCTRNCKLDPHTSKKTSDNQESGVSDSGTSSLKLTNGYSIKVMERKIDGESIWKNCFRKVELALFVVSTIINVIILAYLLIRFGNN